MSKVFDALQRARADQHLLDRIERDAMINRRTLDSVDTHGLPPPKMEKEMSRLLRNITALLPGSQRGIIQFVGSQNHEGTSSILREFGLYVATQMNKSVLLVESEVSHLVQHQALGVHPQIPLERIIREGGSVDQAIGQAANSRVFLCRLGEEATGDMRPTGLVNYQDVWSKLRKAFDFVLIDSAPLISSEETLIHCTFADGVVLVVEAEKTRAQVALNLKDRVIRAGGNVLGVVFNKQRHYIPNWIYKKL